MKKKSTKTVAIPAMSPSHPMRPSRPARSAMKSMAHVPDAPIQKSGRQHIVENQRLNATAPRPANSHVETTLRMPGALITTEQIVEDIRAHHRKRRYAMGMQQTIDRPLESYVRINATGWNPDDEDVTRAEANKKALALIKAARDGEGDADIVELVTKAEKSREGWDEMRSRNEKMMELLAEKLPVAPWVEKIPGFGMLGLATIVGETGDLSKYPHWQKVWKRLGYAPYDGLAGSSWKRDSWRPRSLTKEEWIANPFSGRRYALIHTISIWLKNKQWIGAAKTDDGVGKPNGPYGEVYASRRARTTETHPDWSKGHGHMDALRVMMKAVLKDLWAEWHRLDENGRHGKHDTHRKVATESPANSEVKTNDRMPGSSIKEEAVQ